MGSNKQRESDCVPRSAPMMGFILPEQPPPYSEPSYPHYSQNEEAIMVQPDLNCSTVPVLGQNKPTKVPLYNSGKDVRTVFFRKMYGVLGIQALIMSAFIAMFNYCPIAYGTVDGMPGWKFWPCWVIFLSLASSLTSVEKFMKIMRISPMNFVLLVVVTVTGGLLLGSLSAYLNTEKILLDVGIVAGTCLAVVIFTLQKKYYFTRKLSVCYVWICLFISYGISNFWYGPKESMWILVAPFIFFTYIVVATPIMVNDEDILLLSDECIYGAVSVSMFFVSVIKNGLRICPCCRWCCPK